MITFTAAVARSRAHVHACPSVVCFTDVRLCLVGTGISVSKVKKTRRRSQRSLVWWLCCRCRVNGGQLLISHHYFLLQTRTTLRHVPVEFPFHAVEQCTIGCQLLALCVHVPSKLFYPDLPKLFKTSMRTLTTRLVAAGHLARAFHCQHSFTNVANLCLSEQQLNQLLQPRRFPSQPEGSPIPP